MFNNHEIIFDEDFYGSGKNQGDGSIYYSSHNYPTPVIKKVLVKCYSSGKENVFLAL